MPLLRRAHAPTRVRARSTPAYRYARSLLQPRRTPCTHLLAPNRTHAGAGRRKLTVINTAAEVWTPADVTKEIQNLRSANSPGDVRWATDHLVAVDRSSVTTAGDLKLFLSYFDASQRQEALLQRINANPRPTPLLLPPWKYGQGFKITKENDAALDAVPFTATWLPISHQSPPRERRPRARAPARVHVRMHVRTLLSARVHLLSASLPGPLHTPPPSAPLPRAVAWKQMQPLAVNCDPADAGNTEINGVPVTRVDPFQHRSEPSPRTCVTLSKTPGVGADFFVTERFTGCSLLVTENATHVIVAHIEPAGQTRAWEEEWRRLNPGATPTAEQIRIMTASAFKVQVRKALWRAPRAAAARGAYRCCFQCVCRYRLTRAFTPTSLA